MTAEQSYNTLDSLRWKLSQNDKFHSVRLESFDWNNPEDIPGTVLVKENVQRQVWLFDIGENSCYAKLYLRNGKWSHIKRCLRGPACLKEWEVAHYAISHGVNCVEPLACAISNDPSSRLDCLLITAGKSETLSLTEYWENLSPKSFSGNKKKIDLLIDSIAELLAKTHHAGMTHSDLHPGNLLVQDQNGDKPEVCLVDLHSIRFGKPISDREAIYNIAQLNQWFRQNATLLQRLRLLKRYMYYRTLLSDVARDNWAPETLPYWTRSLDQAAQRHTKKLWASRDRRIMRNSRYFASLKLPGHWNTHVFLKTKHPTGYSLTSHLDFAPDDWEEALSCPEEIISGFIEKIRPIKNTRSALVCRGTLQVGSEQVNVVIKRHRSKKRFARLWDCMRHSRGLRAWKMSFAMMHRGLPVAQPLAVLDQRVGPILLNNLFITEDVTPSVNLRVFLLSILPVLRKDKRESMKRVLIIQLSGLLKKMHRNGFSHRDMKATNILIRNISLDSPETVNPEDLQLVLIDLDGLRLNKIVRMKDQLRALARLSISADLSPHITLADRVRFLKNYLYSVGGGLPDWKSLWRTIQVEREQRFPDHLAG